MVAGTAISLSAVCVFPQFGNLNLLYRGIHDFGISSSGDKPFIKTFNVVLTGLLGISMALALLAEIGDMGLLPQD